MGMWMLAAAAAAKKKQDQRRAAARRARSRREKEEREAKEKNKYRGSSSRDLPSYLECIDQEIDSNQELKEFFQKLYQKVQEIRNEAGAEHRANAEKFRDLAEKYNKEKMKIEKKLEESGINFEGRKPFGSIYLSRFTGEYQSSTWGKSRLSLYREVGDSYIYYQATTINGIERYRLTESLIMEDEPEGYLNVAKSSLEYNQKKYEEAKKKLAKLEKRKLFISYEKKQNMIKKLKNEIREIENNIDSNRMAIKEHEFVLGLTDEQKSDLIKYIEAEKCISDITYKIKNLEYQFEAALPKIDDKQTIFKAMQLLEQDGMTEEEITSVFKILDKIAILKSRGEYEHKPWYRETADIKIIRSFVKEIYESDPDFVDRNLSEVVSIDKGDQEADDKNQDISDNNDDPEL